MMEITPRGQRAIGWRAQAKARLIAAFEAATSGEHDPSHPVWTEQRAAAEAWRSALGQQRRFES